MASSLLHFTPVISKAAAESCLRPISILQNRVCRRMFCSAITGSGDSSFRRVAPPAPWLMLPPSSSAEGGDTNTPYSMYSLTQGKAVRLNSPKSQSEKAKVVGSSHGWLALLNQSVGDLFLRNPITHQNIKLPPLVNLSCGGGVSKVILSCPPSQGEEDQCLAAVAFAGGRNLAFCCPGRSREWTPFGGLSYENGLSRFYPDFVYLSRHKLFFCLAQFDGEEGFDGETWYLHRNAGHAPRAVSRVRCRPSLHEEQKRQVPRDRLRHCAVYAEGSDQLFLVTRLVGDAGKTVGFDVHRFSNEYCRSFDSFRERRADRLCYLEESLDDLVMFVGVNGSFAFPAADYPELKPNSIYFSGDDGDIGVFDYGSKTVSPCYYPIDEIVAAPPFWFTPTISEVVPAADSVMSGGGGIFPYETKIEVEKVKHAPFWLSDCNNKVTVLSSYANV